MNVSHNKLFHFCHNSRYLLCAKICVWRILISLVCASWPIISYAELPVPDANQFVLSGSATFVQDATTATINQATDRAILNWQSFNIGKENTVNFVQPSATSAALNRIHQVSPSQIFGNLNANGQVFLINNNGIVFGQGAQINVGGLTASTLDVSDEVFNELNIVTAITDGRPAFEGGTDSLAEIIVENGAQISTPEGGRVLMFAPNVSNQGEITTPGGQTILGGVEDSVYLYAADAESGIRGLLIELDTGGSVENLGEVIAERGNITLIGQAVRQAGSLSATTSVQENGSIRLLARDGAKLDSQINPTAAFATATGDLIIDEGSATQVLPEQNTQTASDNVNQALSTIELMGKTIHFKSESKVQATGGQITAKATETPILDRVSEIRDESRILLEAGSVVDVSGDDTTNVSVSRYQQSVEVRSNELADLPVQKGGVLQDQEVLIDVRVGTDVVDDSNVVSGFQRTAAERLSVGGSVELSSGGEVIIKEGALIDISGGAINHQSGVISTTLLQTGQSLVGIGDADANVKYDAISESTLNTFVEGYIEGKDGGSINIVSHDAIIEGSISGNTIKGNLQRELPTNLANTPAFARNFLEFAEGSSFSLDLTPSIPPFTRDIRIDNIVQNIGLESAFIDLDTVFAIDHIVNLDQSLFNDSGISAFAITTSGDADLLNGTNLFIQGAGSLSIESFDTTLDGSITIPGGDIEIRSRNSLLLNNGESINVAGLWINDQYPILFGQTPTFDKKIIDGGNISLLGRESLILSQNSSIDVSSGAFLPVSGDLADVRPGNAGGISVGVESAFEQEAVLILDNEFKGYSLLGGQGGTLSIQANAVEINATGEGPNQNTLYLDDRFFGKGGFEQFEITSIRNGVLVDSSAQIIPKLQNFILNFNSVLEDSGSRINDFASTTTFQDHLRSPVSISLNSLQTSISANELKGFSNLIVEEGSSIILDPQGVIEMTSDNSLFIAGRLEAPSGEISLNIVNPEYDGSDLGFLANQTLWLSESSKLIANGAVISQPNPTSFLLPDKVTVLDAGTISLSTERGYIVGEQGSLIDVSGASATSTETNGIEVNNIEFFGDAGSINLKSGDGIILNSTLNANAKNKVAANGSIDVFLSLSASISQLNLANLPGTRVPPVSPRVISISNENTNLPFSQGGAIDDSFHGMALLNANLINAGGFDNLGLTVTKGNSGGIDRIEFTQNLDLALRQSITFDSQVVDLNGNDVRLLSNYVALGPNDSNNQFELSNIISDDGSLTVNANLIDIVGDVAVFNANELSLVSDGDVRLIGSPNVNLLGGTLSGSLNFYGNLSITADQVYPSTLSQFKITNQNTVNGVVQFNRSENSDSTIQSALASLRVESPVIVNNGVIKAPGGQIELVATDRLELNPNSITSVSLEDNSILFGRTEAGDWVYTVNDDNTIFTVEIENLPDSFINFDSENIIFADDAIVDISGGGELLSYEHIPGPNGTFDILDIDINPEYFAVIPNYVNDYGASDHIESTNFQYAIGSQFTLDQSSGGLPAGTYTILPARYALLPGAFLVRPESGFEGISSAQSILQADGTSIVAGRIGIANTGIVDVVNQGYSIVSQSSIIQFAEYKTTGANSFFDVGVPNDAKRVTFLAGSNLDFLGSIEGSAENGRAGFVDIVSNKIAIINSSTSATIGPDFLQLNADALRSINAQSISIGANRETNSEGTIINTQSSDIILTENTVLSGNEIILVASDNIVIENNAKIDATGEKNTDFVPDNLILNGDGALLRVSSFNQVELSRENITENKGNLSINENSLVRASNSITLDATNEFNLNGEIEAVDGSLNIVANAFTLNGVGNDGLSLDQEFFDGNLLSELIFTSRSTIDIADNISFDLDRLVFDAPEIRSSENTDITLSAVNFILKNSGGNSFEGLNQGSGSLSVESAVTAFEGGNYALTGFDKFNLSATEQVLFSGNNEFLFNGNEIVINTNKLVGENGASLLVNAESSDVSILSNGLPSIDVNQKSFVSSISLFVNSLNFDSEYQSAGGSFNVVSNNDIMLGENSRINLGGDQLDFIVAQESIPGGRIDLFSVNGSINSLAGSMIDISADPLFGDAGSLLIDAKNGSLSLGGDIFASASDAYKSGSVDIEANSFVSVSNLNEKLNTAGAFEKRFLRTLTGDITIENGDLVKASNIELVADQGSIIVSDGMIDASGVNGGNVRLVALDEIRVDDNGVIDISAQLDSVNNAGELSLEVSSSEGQINLLNGGIVNLSGGSNGGNNGKINARIQGNPSSQDLVNDLANRVTWQATGLTDAITSNFNVYLSNILTNTVTDTDANVVFNIIEQADVNALFNEVSNYLNVSKNALLTEVNLDNFQVVAETEFVSQENRGVSTNSRIDFSELRYEGMPGVFTLRSQGDLIVNQDITDGFDGANNLMDEDSWGINLLSGIDITSADIFSTNRNVGNLIINDNVKVRTGTGDINLFSGNDIILNSDDSVVYTSGRDAGFGTYGSGGVLTGLQYGKDGGDITINSQGSYLATDNKQFVTDWLYRWGDGEPFPFPRDVIPTMWIVNFDNFKQGIGILGGGNAEVNIRGDAENISVSIPTVAISQSQGPGDNTHDVLGGGDLVVNVGGNLNGAEFYVEKGKAQINIVGSIGNTIDPDTGLLIGLGDAQANILSGLNINIDAIVNPFLLPQHEGQQFRRRFPETYYTTYTDQSSIEAVSLIGALTYDARADSIDASELRITSNDAFAGFGYVPGKVKFAALQNDIFLTNDIYLHSNIEGNLELIAWNNITTQNVPSSASLEVQMLANDLNNIPSPFSPTDDIENILDVRGASGQPDLLFAVQPVHLNDFENSRIIARNGNIEADASGGRIIYLLAEPTDFFAGTDIVNPNIRLQHSKDEDISTIQAGRDVIFPSLRARSSGALTGNSNQIVVDGRGLLEVIAGRNVDLGLSAGISTVGNLNNPFLDDVGASILTLAGVNPEDAFLESLSSEDLILLLDDFISGELGNRLVSNGIDGVDAGARNTITDSETLSALDDLQVNISNLIVEYAQNKTGDSSLTLRDATFVFDQSRQDEKRAVFADIIFETVKTSAIIASTGGSDGNLNTNNFDLAFGILELFHPEESLSNGNLTLFNSSIETIEGGDIGIIVPYGQIDAGLPSVAAGARDTDQIGIITQREGDISIVTRGNVNVNRSRIFALGGGDLLFWSSLGSVDAGRGAQDSLEIPPPVSSIDANGNIVTEFPPAISGSGIRTASTREGISPGDVVFGVPNGVVDAGDAGIDVGGSLVLAAEEVIGRDNFTVGGEVSGVQLSEAGPPIALTTQADSTSAGVSDSVENSALGAADEQAADSLGTAALKWLEVFVIGYGEDETASISVKTCKDDSEKCES